MRKFLLLSLLLVSCLSISADGGNKKKSLTVKTLDGTTASFDAKNFDIFFRDGNLLVEQNGQTLATIPQNTLDEMYFSDDEPSGILDIQGGSCLPQGSAYNLQGVRVDDNYKGIVIVGGKKILQR